MMKNLLFLIVGALCGCLSTYAALRSLHRVVLAQPATASKTAAPLKVMLYRFELNPKSLSRFDDWVRFEHAHHEETVATLEREKMYFEAIFRDRVQEKDMIYWLTINGEGGAHSDTSPLGIDKQYQQFMQETPVFAG